jgi:hypothetical protein
LPQVFLASVPWRVNQLHNLIDDLAKQTVEHSIFLILDGWIDKEDAEWLHKDASGDVAEWINWKHAKGNHRQLHVHSEAQGVVARWRKMDLQFSFYDDNPLVVLDDDMRVPPSYLADVLKLLKEHRAIAWGGMTINGAAPARFPSGTLLDDHRHSPATALILPNAPGLAVRHKSYLNGITKLPYFNDIADRMRCDDEPLIAAALWRAGVIAHAYTDLGLCLDESAAFDERSVQKATQRPRYAESMHLRMRLAEATGWPWPFDSHGKVREPYRKPPTHPPRPKLNRKLLK